VQCVAGVSLILRRLISLIDIRSVFIFLGVLLASAVFIAAADGDLWLDEVWSMSFAEMAKSPWEIVSVYKHDNNHVLNTIILYLIGKQETLLYYRIPAILSGIGALLLMTRIALKWGDAECMLVLLLAGTSYPLIIYFSEARGYAPAMFFALLAFLTLQDLLRDRSPWRTALFWLALVLGTLSHLTFIMVFFSLIIFGGLHEFESNEPLINKVVRMAQLFFVPGAFIVAFYFYYATGMAIGGGEATDRLIEIDKGFAYLLGFPDKSIQYGMPALTAFAIIVAGTYLLYRNKDRSWSFYLSVLLVAPILMIAVAQPKFFFFRYVIVCFPFFYLMLAYILGKLYRMGEGKFRPVIVLVIGLYLIGQSPRVALLLEFGRGEYRSIVAAIYSESMGKPITVGGDNDFRNLLMLAFYSRLNPSSQTISYIKNPYKNTELPDWYLTHSFDCTYQPPLSLVLRTQGGDHAYSFTKKSTSSCGTGFRWFLYHRVHQKPQPAD
jgi:hypothetical protein